ncbi:MAG TPA: hypothetical protein VJK71_10925 [Gemmatimonadales bacterium]|nr:hypothetical protein [Gemmatimonadales bacterium]
MVEGDVGAPKKAFGVPRVLREEGQPDACRYVYFPTVDSEWGAHSIEQLPSHAGGVFRIADPLQDHGELVPAQPRHGVDLSDASFQPRRHLPENLISGGVAELVVHFLEVIEIDLEQRQRIAAPFRPGQGPAYAVVKQ